MPKIIPMVGKKFGRLTVLRATDEKKGRDILYACRCDCGAESINRGYSLRVGDATSCGCARNERIGALRRSHGKTRTPEYRSWAMMKARCLNPSNQAFGRYGGRGIGICPQWINSFETFLADMGPRPSPRHSLDRIDSDGNYEPGNCRWATWTMQGRNRSGIKLSMTDAADIRRLKASGIPNREIADRYGVDPSSVSMVLLGKTWWAA